MSNTCRNCGGWKSKSARLCQDCRNEKLADRKEKRLAKRDTQREKLRTQREKVSNLQAKLKSQTPSKKALFRRLDKEIRNRGIIPGSEEERQFVANYTYDKKKDESTERVTRLAKAFLYTKYGYSLKEEYTMPNSKRRLDLFLSSSQLVVVGEVKTKYGDAKRLPTQLYTYYKDLRQFYSQKILIYAILDKTTYDKIISKDYAVFDVLRGMDLPGSETRLLVINIDTSQARELIKEATNG